MNVKSIIHQAEQAGIELFLSGDRIAARPKSNLSADLRELIKTHRREVVTYLSNKSPQSTLVRLAIQSGRLNHGLQLEEQEIARLVPPSDWSDTAECTPEELKAWGELLALRAVRHRGIVPNGWGQVAHCKNCGPVYSYVAGDYLACPWCEQKRAGVYFQQPDH